MIPIIYNLLSKIISQKEDASGIFKMQSTSLNPQTILYKTDSNIKNYFQAAVGSTSNGLTLEQRSENIPEMNKYIWRKLNPHQKITISLSIPL